VAEILGLNEEAVAKFDEDVCRMRKLIGEGRVLSVGMPALLLDENGQPYVEFGILGDNQNILLLARELHGACQEIVEAVRFSQEPTQGKPC